MRKRLVITIDSPECGQAHKSMMTMVDEAPIGTQPVRGAAIAKP